MPEKKAVNSKGLIVYIFDFRFDCSYFVAVYDKDDNYVTGKSRRAWVDSEQDCLEEIAGVVQDLTAQYPEDKRFCVQEQ